MRRGAPGRWLLQLLAVVAFALMTAAAPTPSLAAAPSPAPGAAGRTPSPGKDVALPGPESRAVLPLPPGMSDPALMAHAVARLSRLSYRLLWWTPLATDPAYRPITRAMAAIQSDLDGLAGARDLATLLEQVQQL